MNCKKAYIDFYREHSISPVVQDIKNIDKHLQRREALYRHLGLLPSFFQHAEILEFGPGNGHNALYPLRLKPKAYDFVEGNEKACKELEKLIHFCDCSQTTVNITKTCIEEYCSSKRFDIVICEGVIPTQNNPFAFAEHIASFVKPGGVLIVSCADSVSFLSESLRRIVSFYLAPETLGFRDRIRILKPVFDSHLETLGGMSRSHEDWIIDNMIQPFYGPLWSVSDAVQTLSSDFEVYYSSPHFITDWRWYKDIFGSERKYNERAVELYRSQLHCLLSCRHIFRPRRSEENMKLKEMTDVIWKLTQAPHPVISNKVLKIVGEYVRNISILSADFSEELSEAFYDYNQLLKRLINGRDEVDFGRFSKLFGRGQQYLSFVKRKNGEIYAE